MTWLKPYAKLLVALVGAFVSVAIAAGVDSATAEGIAQAVTAILVAAGVYSVPNTSA